MISADPRLVNRKEALMTHLISRKIEIDAAHRVPDHQGKCRNLHGHRYVVEAVCAGTLHDAGPESGMVIDFAFLKEEMTATIDAACDHAIILWEKDPLLDTLLGKEASKTAGQAAAGGTRLASPYGPIQVVPATPTAENLARYWFEALRPRIALRSGDRAELIEIKVWETPNSWASYAPGRLDPPP